MLTSEVEDVDELSYEAPGGPHSPSQPITEPQHKLKKWSRVRIDDLTIKLAAHEEMYQETMKLLEREEEKLKEQRKQAGGSTTKSKKLVQDMFELNALKQFNSLRIEYHRKKAQNPSSTLCPSLKASTAIAKRLGKSNYAQRLQEKVTYLHRVGELQTPKQGKIGRAHV